MTGRDLKKALLAAAFVVPTSTLDGWKELQFNKIPKNKVSVVGSGAEIKKLKIEVNQSASPLIYKLPEIIPTKKIEFTFNVKDLDPDYVTEQSKKSDFPEDSVLRIGLVAKGRQTLNWFQKKIAAGWVLELFSLAPENVGLDKIYFQTISLSKELLGKKRSHPKSDLMVENVVGTFPQNNSISHELSPPLDVVAIWVSVDGDDSKASYSTEIADIRLIQ